MANNSLPVLNYKQGMSAIVKAAKAKRVALLIGPPGIGKTSICALAAKQLDMPLVIIIGSNYDATDFAGLPYIVDGKVLRAIFPALARACDEPVCLVLDEITAVPPSVQAPLLRLLLERVLGDGTSLHPETVVLAACNPPEQAPGGVSLSAATANRVSQLNVRPSIDEVSDYFSTLSSPHARSFAAVLSVKADLIQFDPPGASVDGGVPWGSPRGWEIGFNCVGDDGDVEGDVEFALLAGCVGPHPAAAFIGIAKLRNQLPTIEEILKDPAGAKMPTAKDVQIGVLSILPLVAERDLFAGLIYANRMLPEYMAASSRTLIKFAPPKKSPHMEEGRKAQMVMLERISRSVNKKAPKDGK